MRCLSACTGEVYPITWCLFTVYPIINGNRHAIPTLNRNITTGCRIPRYVFTAANTPFMWSMKIGQSSWSFCSKGALSVKSNKTGKKHTTQETMRAVTGVFRFELINSVMPVRAPIPRILDAKMTKNICKNVKL